MSVVPEQHGMAQRSPDEVATGSADMLESSPERDLFGSESPRASHLATAGYVLIAIGHAVAILVQWSRTTSGGEFYTWLLIVQVVLCFEASVYAAGDLSCWLRSKRLRALGLQLLELAGRLRLLVTAIVWGWLVPWAAELACRCGSLTPENGYAMVWHSAGLALFISGFFGIREFSFLIKGEPPSALNMGVNAQFGDCLPSNALLGGQFRLSKEDLEGSGRAIFVPARPRSGLYIGSGLAMLAHLICGIRHLAITGSPWWFIGAASGLLGRRLGDMIGGSAGRKSKGEDDTVHNDQGASGPFKLDRVLLLTRAGEMWWIWCCIQELQRCEALPTWLSVCAAPAAAV